MTAAAAVTDADPDPGTTDAETIRVELTDRSYDIVLGTLPNNLGDVLAEATGRLPTSAFIVYDENVETHAVLVRDRLQASGMAVTTAAVPSRTWR